ncbi:MAG TPA: response regulator [Polyangia bacterium]|jgi:CheY-like chemotaxis protein|nr:response regulator [Polyangia bacterium]
MAKRIVIADDSATIQRAFAMTFGAEDVTLAAARSVDEAISLARQLQPELVIADGMMPGRSGYDLCAEIKADPGLSGTAVYILASSQQPYDESRGRQCGADGHFVKPFDTTVLIEKVHDALARGPMEKPLGAPPPADELGPPIPFDATSGIPSGVTMPLAAAFDDDEYGEISVDMSPPADAPGAREAEFEAAPLTPPPVRPTTGTPAPAPGFSFSPAGTQLPSLTPAPPASLFPPASTPPLAAGPSAGGMRPSLIPGIRPGAMPPARPGAAPVRPATLSAGPAARPPSPVSRTLMGLPAANVPIPGTSRSSSSPPLARPTPAPLAPAPPRPAVVPSASGGGGTPSPLFSQPGVATTPRPLSVALPPTVSAAVGTAVDQKIAAIGARGPEYEAIARLSREIIEQIVWEVVPELAEVIIREHVERHVRA